MFSSNESIAHLSKLSTPSQFSRKLSTTTTKNKSILLISEVNTFNEKKSQYEDLSLIIIDEEKTLETCNNKLSKLKKKMMLIMNSITPSLLAHMAYLYPRMNQRITDAVWGFFGFEVGQKVLMTSSIQTEVELHHLIEMSISYQRNKKGMAFLYEDSKRDIKNIIDNCNNDSLVYPYNVLFELFLLIYDLCDLESKIKRIYQSLAEINRSKECVYSNILVKEMELSIKEKEKENKNHQLTKYSNIKDNETQSSLNKSKNKIIGNKTNSPPNRKHNQVKKRNITYHSQERSLNNRQIFKNSSLNTNANSNQSQASSPMKTLKIDNPSFENVIIEGKERQLLFNEYQEYNMKSFSSTHNNTKNITTKPLAANHFIKQKEKNLLINSMKNTITSSFKSKNKIQFNKIPKFHKLIPPLCLDVNQIDFTELPHKTSNSLVNKKKKVYQGKKPIKDYQIQEINKHYHTDNEEKKIQYKPYNFENKMNKDVSFINKIKFDFGSNRKENEKHCGCCISCT